MALLTSHDLRMIADTIEPLELLEALTENEMVGRIELHLPGDDQVVGYLSRGGKPDGSGEAWLGFEQVAG